MTVRINASSDGLTETVDTSGILEFQTANTSALVIDASQNANFTSAGAIVVPVGTTATRPSAANGMIRYNSNSAAFEVYANNSWATANVTPAPTVVSAPVISGTAVVGNNLTCTTGTWNNNPTGYFYQWLANSVAISANATSNVFTLTSTQNNTNITCNVTAFNAAGNSIPSTSNSLGPVVTGYFLNRSLRFRSSASAYLNRTPSASNRKTWTWSGWLKLGTLGAERYLFTSDNGNDDSNEFNIILNSNNVIQIGGGQTNWRITSQVFRDPSAWYHLVFAIDTTQATAANRIRIYVNGSEVTAFSTNNNPSQNADLAINQAAAHNIGRRLDNTFYFDGYMAEIHFIDGQALTPSSFGESNTNTGVWQPKAYTGTYGTNGFYLKFETLTSTSTLGNDSSGNGNNWTTNNFSLTAGATYDSMKDVPTLTDADTANYAVINPLVNSNGVMSNGNLTYAGTSAGNKPATLTGAFKQYAEITINTGTASAFGIATATADMTQNTGLSTTGMYGIYDNGTGFYLFSNGTTITNIAGQTSSGVVFQIAYDAVDNKLWIGKNNTWYNSTLGTTGDPAAGTNPTLSSLPSDLRIFVGTGNFTTTYDVNFGQRPFAYTPPSGFVALNTFNLPTPTIGTTSSTQANDYMNVVLYTGTGAAQTISGVGFKPDFTWIKSRSNSTNHAVFDVIRPSGFAVYPNLTDAEANNSTLFTGFTSDGFGVANTNITYNQNASTYVAWNWKAGTSNVTNTSGTITSTVNVNATAGFSVVTYTGTGANATVGHGLGVAPRMILIKARTPTNTSDNWQVYHATLGNTQFLELNTTAAAVTASNRWNNTSPTSTVFTIGTVPSSSGDDYVAYCFAEIDGYSKFDRYLGNGSSDGPFVYCGFRPKFLMIKNINDAGAFWANYDSVRDQYNVVFRSLFPNAVDAETTNTNILDFTSNGFKIRTTATFVNTNNQTIIFAAFAESPFKYALAR